MIKSTVENPAEEKEEISYPCLMKIDDRYEKGLVVLFNKTQRGIVVSADEEEMFCVGYESDTWVLNRFKPLPKGAKVTLQNI